MFSRATITLGIGPHSSSLFFYSASSAIELVTRMLKGSYYSIPDNTARRQIRHGVWSVGWSCPVNLWDNWFLTSSQLTTPFSSSSRSDMRRFSVSSHLCPLTTPAELFSFVFKLFNDYRNDTDRPSITI